LYASGTAAFVDIPIKAGYRQTFETTNQFAPDQVLRNHSDSRVNSLKPIFDEFILIALLSG